MIHQVKHLTLHPPELNKLLDQLTIHQVRCLIYHPPKLNKLLDIRNNVFTTNIYLINNMNTGSFHACANMPALESKMMFKQDAPSEMMK